MMPKDPKIRFQLFNRDNMPDLINSIGQDGAYLMMIKTLYVFYKGHDPFGIFLVHLEVQFQD